MFMNQKLKGERKTFNGVNLTVKGDYNTITGPNCTSSGDYCNITGPNCKSNGDRCKITGPNCESKGDYCTVTGPNCNVKGDYNKVKGVACKVKGIGNEYDDSEESYSVNNSVITNSAIGTAVAGGINVGRSLKDWDKYAKKGNKYVNHGEKYANYGNVVQTMGHTGTIVMPFGNRSLQLDLRSAMTQQAGGRISVTAEGHTIVGTDKLTVDGVDFPLDLLFESEVKVRYAILPLYQLFKVLVLDRVEEPKKQEELKGDDEKTEVETELCCICTDNARKISLSCGHYCLCFGCYNALIKPDYAAANKCPICQVKFTSASRIY